MSYARQMLDTYSPYLAVDAGLLAAAIDAAGDCAQACAADTDADLSEPNLAEMVTCIRLCLDAPISAPPPPRSSAARQSSTSAPPGCW